jgi:hypothetical protein
VPPLPAANLRSNRGTWAVPPCALPAVAAVLREALPPEAYDPAFRGQHLETTYFDTTGFRLRKARKRGDKYLTLRLRCYRDGHGGEAYALSAKTEGEKFRAEVDAAAAHAWLEGQALAALVGRLPAHLQARLLDLAGDRPLVPVVCVRARRYAVEDGGDRLTLDVEVQTDRGQTLPYAVLEFKSTDAEAAPPAGLPAAGCRPLKLSKFLWATR